MKLCFTSLIIGISLISMIAGAAEFKLPGKEKKVIAHYMTNMLFFKGGSYSSTYYDKVNYRPDGPTAFMGGSTQSYPLMDFRYSEDRVGAAAKEILAAKKLGVDGFHFFYPYDPKFSDSVLNPNIIAFFKAADRLKVDFKMTLCLCLPLRPVSEAEKVKVWGNAIKKIYKAVGKNNSNWLKTADGRNIFFLWNGDFLADKVSSMGDVFKRPEVLSDVAKAYKKLADHIGIKAAFVYDLRSTMHKEPEFYNQILKNFPATWAFIPRPDGSWQSYVAASQRAKIPFIRSLVPDFYTSKPYKKNGKRLYDRLWRLEDMKKLGVDGMWRRVISVNLSDEYRKNLEAAIKENAPIISVTTWNDYPEGQQICPDINHNFAYAILLKYYKNIWQKKSFKNNKDIGLVFFKKYAAKVKPVIWDFEVREDKPSCKIALHRVNEKPLVNEDFIEAAVILTAPAKIYLNQKYLGTFPKGITVKRIASRPGKVSLKAVRKGKVLFNFAAPEWITDKPYRTDRFTYSFSSEYMKYWKSIFGNRKMETSCEYAEDAKNIPQWKRIYNLKK